MKPIHPLRPSARKSIQTSMSMFLPFRLSIVLLGLGIICSHGAWAQQPGAMTTCTNIFSSGCSDPRLQQGTASVYDSSNPSTDKMPVSADQQQDKSNNAVYIDQGGITQPGSNQLLTSAPPVMFPPEPITDLQRLARSSTGEVLPIFGRDLFQNVPSTFAPGDQVAAPSDYVVGPQDEVMVRLGTGNI